jgi:hypothetical protein
MSREAKLQLSENARFGEINPRFGERGAEGMPECVGMAAWNSSRRPVVTKDRAQARRGQRLTAIGSFGHHE